MTGNTPSVAYQRHHDIEAPRIDASAFRQGWRVHSRLDALLRDGRLTAGQWQAAVEYRAAWERVEAAAGAGNSTLAQTGPGQAAGGGAADRLAAIADTVTRLREVEARIGTLASGLCLCCVVRDLPWAELARVMHRDPHTVRDWTVLAIRALAVGWSDAQRRRRPQAAYRHRPRPGAV